MTRKGKPAGLPTFSEQRQRQAHRGGYGCRWGVQSTAVTLLQPGVLGNSQDMGSRTFLTCRKPCRPLPNRSRGPCPFLQREENGRSCSVPCSRELQTAGVGGRMHETLGVGRLSPAPSSSHVLSPCSFRFPCCKRTEALAPWQSPNICGPPWERIPMWGQVSALSPPQLQQLDGGDAEASGKLDTSHRGSLPLEQGPPTAGCDTRRVSPSKPRACAHGSGSSGTQWPLCGGARRRHRAGASESPISLPLPQLQASSWLPLQAGVGHKQTLGAKCAWSPRHC